MSWSSERVLHRGVCVQGVLAVVVGCVWVEAADPVVSKVWAVQRPGTELVDITYDVADPDSSVVNISVAVSDSGGATYTVPAVSFSGEVGPKVAPGRGKRIVWDAGRDWPGKFSANMCFKVTAQDSAPAPQGMVLIPAGSFQMGDTFNEGYSDELPVHTVYVSGFYMDRTEVTKALWDEVYTWAVSHGYRFEWGAEGKAPDHPARSMTWYDAVKWCNARSEKEGRVPAYYTSAAQTDVYRSGQVDVENDWVKWDAGYRLPTEAEWEKAARGGLSGKRFPWGDTISHSQANYYSYWEGGKPYYRYDVNGYAGYHTTYEVGEQPYTSPVGSFGANGYGLYDMAGNVWEWCWDRYDFWYYSSSAPSDPRGPSLGLVRVIRGASWVSYAGGCRVSDRSHAWPGSRLIYVGFRSVLPPGQ